MVINILVLFSFIINAYVCWMYSVQTVNTWRTNRKQTMNVQKRDSEKIKNVWWTRAQHVQWLDTKGMLSWITAYKRHISVQLWVKGGASGKLHVCMNNCLTKLCGCVFEHKLNRKQQCFGTCMYTVSVTNWHSIHFQDEEPVPATNCPATDWLATNYPRD